MDAETLNGLSQRAIGCALTVARGLGIGFVEKVYENALAHELRKAQIPVAQQARISVQYDGVSVGEFSADLLVDAALLVEVKAVQALVPAHRAQCLNYLRATGLRLCLLINFGTPRLEIKRVANGL